MSDELVESLTDNVNLQQDESAVRQQLADKAKKALPAGMADELDSMDGEALKCRILMSERNMSDVNIAERRDIDLEEAKERVKGLKAPYSDARKAQQAIITYSNFRLHQRGE